MTDMHREAFIDCVDHTHRLGFCDMPNGYRLLQLDSGHFIFHREADEAESAIHWNKWAVVKWAKADALRYRDEQEKQA